MTTIIKDLRANTEFAAKQWKQYEAAIRCIGDTESLRAANEGLGYNLVRTIPGLLQWIQELEEELEEERNTVRIVTKSTADAMDKGRPLGIPAEHVVLNVRDSPELEVVTEEAPVPDWKPPNDSFGVFYT